MKLEKEQMPRSPNGRIYVFVSPDRAYGFIRSLKVGSNTMTNALQLQDWEQILEIPEDSCQLFGLIRHPFDRWVSGTAQYWAGYHTEPERDKDRAHIELLRYGDIRWFIEEGSHDQHTQPQAWNFDDYPNTKFFKFENLTKVWDWLEVPNPKIHIRNHLKMGLQGEMRQLIAERAEPYRQLILDIYREDYEMWKTAI